MGGSSSSSNSSQHTRNNDFSTVDYRAITGEGGGYIEGNTTANVGDDLIDGDGNNITFTKSDFGAIQTGGEIAMQSLDFADSANKRALDAVDSAESRAYDFASDEADDQRDLTKQLVSQSLGIVEKRSASQQEQLIGQFRQIFTIFVVGVGGTVGAVYYFRSK